MLARRKDCLKTNKKQHSTMPGLPQPVADRAYFRRSNGMTGSLTVQAHTDTGNIGQMPFDFRRYSTFYQQSAYRRYINFIFAAARRFVIHTDGIPIRPKNLIHRTIELPISDGSVFLHRISFSAQAPPFVAVDPGVCGRGVTSCKFRATPRGTLDVSSCVLEHG